MQQLNKTSLFKKQDNFYQIVPDEYINRAILNVYTADAATYEKGSAVSDMLITKINAIDTLENTCAAFEVIDLAKEDGTDSEYTVLAKKKKEELENTNLTDLAKQVQLANYRFMLILSCVKSKRPRVLNFKKEKQGEVKPIEEKKIGEEQNKSFAENSVIETWKEDTKENLLVGD